ncbi:PaaI family thioesterase [Pseudomonas sp. NPDC089406]
MQEPSLSLADNPDRHFIERFIADGARDLPVPGSPLARQLYMRLLRASHGAVDASFQIGMDFTQGGGVIQGGIVAAMLDFGLAFAALSVLDTGRTAVTTSLNVNYLRPASTGLYHVHAVLEKQGRTLIYASAKLLDANERPIAIASSPMAIVSM